MHITRFRSRKTNASLSLEPPSIHRNLKAMSTEATSADKPVSSVYAPFLVPRRVQLNDALLQWEQRNAHLYTTCCQR